MKNKASQTNAASSAIPHQSNKRFSMRSVGLYLTLLFCLILVVAFLLERLSLLVLYAYGIMSILTFIVYAWDKAAAKRDRRRVPEKYLQLLALACGWPGAVMAQRWIRHKSIKRRFQIVFWLMVIANCLILGASLSHSGQHLLAYFAG